MQLTERFRQGVRLVGRNRRARRLGFRFQRARDFELPRELRVAGRWIPLAAPNEAGIRTAFVEILLDDCYGLEILRNHNVPRILDIGGNVGIFALATRHVFPQATIHVYEPNPRVLPFLTQHAAAASFTCFAEAIGRDDGRISLIDHQDCVQVRTRVDAVGNVPQIAFSRAIERIGGHCELVKLDCEGAEWDILSDADSWQQVDHLAMEYHLWARNHRHEDIPPLLRAIGFQIERQIEHHPMFGVVWATRERS